MLEHYTSSHTLGLIFDAHVIKGAQISLSQKKPRIDKLFILPFEEPVAGENVKPLDIDEKNSLSDLSQRCLTISGIPSGSTLVRPLEVKLTKDRDIDSILAFQAEPLLPYPVENALLDSIKLEQTKESTSLTLVATRKEQLKTHLGRLQERKIEPEVVSSTPAALAAFSQYFSLTPHQPVFVINIDKQETTCILALDGKLITAHSSLQGTLNLAAGIAKDKQLTLSEAFQNLIHIDFTKISKENMPELHHAWEGMRMEIARTIFAIVKQAKTQKISEILLTGEGGIFPTLNASLSQILNNPISIPKPGLGKESSQLQEYAISIGLALSALPTYHAQINFRQGDFAFPNPWKRYKIPLILYFTFCCLLALLIYIFGNTWAGYKEDQIKQDYVAMLKEINQPYSAFEKEFLIKTDPSKANDSIKPVKALSQEELKERLQYLLSSIQATPDIFPLLPNVPRVSDVLGWLAAHPNVVLKGKKAEPLLQIESFNYSMVKRPEQGKKQEKYQVKIEIEFTTSTPKLAREFHDALIAPNDLVDPKAEIKWTSNRDRYRTSFFVKDKTIYPMAGS